MPELHLDRTGDTLTIRFGELSATIPFAGVALHSDTWDSIYKDAIAYGRALFDNTFRDEQLRTRLSNLPANERLLLVADDPSIAAIPWEYLRDQHSKLLASRLTFLRGLPETERRDSFTFAAPLEIVAIPVSPIDESRVLDVEREWRDLVEAITTGAPTEALTLKRVRPPTRSDMAGALNRRATSIVHFMGHSASRDGKAWLVFEDARASSNLVDAADFGDALSPRVLLVVLNSCLSAVVAPTEFGNIARSLVRRAFPYALGTQFFLPDDAALVLSKALYSSLVQGASVEEAVTHVRRSLEEPGKLPNPAWLVGIPVFYTSLRAPAPPLELPAGKPIIQPDPDQLEKTTDLTALPKAEHFVGRGKEIRQVLDALLAPHARGFVLLHGLGGIGKTATARAVAERIGWHYQDRVLALSFETFASMDSTGALSVSEPFADRFYNRLARFYGLDPAQYPTAIELQQAILQRRTRLRSLLILDNIETLIDAQKRDHPAATSLASFIVRLKEGDGAILLTSRIVPPADWGNCEVIPVSGLSDEAGADLFLALLPTDREHLALPDARTALSQRVQGHPLSIRLLAGRFADESVTDLATFLQQIEAELESAEQQTPSSLEDPNRHRTLYACMDYSVRRLSPDQRKVLSATGLFLAPFLPEFAAYVLDDEVKAPKHLQDLIRLGLLTATTRTFQEGSLLLLELHHMLRWYIQHHHPAPDVTLQERYGEVYKRLAGKSSQTKGGYDQSSLMRYLVRQSLSDFEAALRFLQPAGRSSLAFHLAIPYVRLGQYRRALALYEQALEIDQELGDMRSVRLDQNAIADLLVKFGKLQEALALYEQSLQTMQELGDMQVVANTQRGMAELYQHLGQPQKALVLYDQSLHTMRELGNMRGVAMNQFGMVSILKDLGKLQESLALCEQSLHTMQELGDMRSVALTQSQMAHLLQNLGKPHEALTLYEQSLHTMQELGDVREISTTKLSMANLLRLQSKFQEALVLYEQVLQSSQALGEVQGVAAAEFNLSRLLLQQGDYSRAIHLAWDAYNSMKQNDFSHNAQSSQNLLLSMKRQVLGTEQFDTLWQQVITEAQPDWLREVQASSSSVQARISSEQLNAIVANIIAVMTVMPEKRDESREMMAGDLRWTQERNLGKEAEFFTAILAILDDEAPSLAEYHSYAEQIKAIQAGIAAGGLDVERDAVEDALPFDAELIPQSIAALLGSPQEKMVHSQRLLAQATETSDEELKTLLQVIQLALFSNDFSQLGRDLRGVYRQAWETIAVSVEAGGVDPEVFEAIARNTLAVLGPAAKQRGEWRSNLVDLRNHVTAHGDRNMAALLEAVIGLLDAGGNPAGLGGGLQGIYAQTWQRIVQELVG